MATNALLAKLNAARERLFRAQSLVKDNPRGESWAELRAAQADVSDFERDVAMADGLECAEPCDAIPLWNIGASCPTVLRGLGRVVLIYFARGDPDPKWDGASARMVSPGDTLSEGVEGVVVLRFERPRAVRTGTPNDEVLQAHPLAGAGLAAYRGHTVVNSSWVKSLRMVNAVHRQYDAKSWDLAKHYILTFKDETFECVADGVKVELRAGSVADAARELLPEVL